MTVDEPTTSEDLLPVVMGPKTGDTRAKGILINVALYAICMLGAVALASLLVILTTDASPFDVIHALYLGSLSEPAAIGRTVEQATPILIVATGLVVTSRAGVFSIGPEGQFLIGVVFTGMVIFKLGLPPVPAIVLGLIAGAVGGGLWAGIAAVLRYWRGVDVIISTLLLNFVAIEVLSFFLNKTWLLQEKVNKQVLPPQSPSLNESFRLPRITIGGFTTTSGIILALVLVALMAFLGMRTRWGFRSRMLGLNPNSAQAAGVSKVLVGGGSLVISGLFAGLAGGVWFTGVNPRVVLGSGGTMPGEGLLTALISRRNPIVIVPVALFFGALRAGGLRLAATGVPSNIVQIVQALVVLAALLPPAILHVAERRKAVKIAQRAAAAEIASQEKVEVAA